MYERYGENTDIEKDANSRKDYFCGRERLISNVKIHIKSLNS